MIEGRYLLYGVIPSEHEDANKDLINETPEAQRIAGTLPLYGTDDKKEALTIYRAGGFERKGNWLAVTWAKDTETGMTVGASPENQEMKSRLAKRHEEESDLYDRLGDK